MTTPSAFPPVNRTIERALSEAIDIQDLASAIVIALRADGYELQTLKGVGASQATAIDAQDKGPTGVSSFAIHTNEETGIDAPVGRIAPSDHVADDKPDRNVWTHTGQIPNSVLVVCRSGHICEREQTGISGQTRLVERTSRRPLEPGSWEGAFTRYREVIPTLSATATTTAILSTPDSRVDPNNRESMRSVHRMMWTAMYIELNEQHMGDIGKPWRCTTNDAAFAYEAFANRPF